MLGYATLGTNDLARATAFYDEVFGLAGAQQMMNDGRMCFYGSGGMDGVIAVCTPFDGAAASVGNGMMLGFKAGSRANVDAVHAKALELGGSDEGAPGDRNVFYSAYFRDLDGNKLVVYHMGE